MRQERENTLSDVTSSTKGHASPAYQACLAEKKQVARAILADWKAEVHTQAPQVWEAALQGRRDTAERFLNDPDALCVYKALFPQRLTTLEAHGRQPSQPREVRPFWKAEHVLEAGHGRIRELAQDLLGAPNPHLSVKSTLRFGSHGKIAVHIAGDKEGLWHDFSTGLGGSILQLIQQEKGLFFREALNYGAWFWGAREGIRDDATALRRDTAGSEKARHGLHVLRRSQSFTPKRAPSKAPLRRGICERFEGLRESCPPISFTCLEARSSLTKTPRNARPTAV